MRGIGDAYLATTALGDGTGKSQKLYPNSFFEFTYNAETETLEAQGQVGGRQQTVAAAQGATTHNFTLTTQFVSYPNRPLIMGHLPKIFSTVAFPVRTDVILDSAVTIADAAVTVGNSELFIVYDDIVGPLTRTATNATAPANSGEYQYKTAAPAGLVFHSSAEGHTITYTKPTTYTNIKGFGGAGNATALGRLTFRGKVFGFGSEESLIEFPALDLINVTELPLTGEVPTFSMEFLAAIPSGWSHPYREIFPGV
ncbi:MULTISPECIES: hypothetical protein [Cyanophyceae]|uniref:hypothetical protein n=1 Tax=Cyanophyceae TaxID=3028117 RepID=UPI001689E770|nr:MULTISPECIES: hypothetical protein [Cyanophyceae]MBD1918851.1 hypothetical protein [Phormidium sp. FACHB-77]MBD2033306.1 hypothetical protein [Phormidium sp. FACHB-322]MBD2053761.1 hypothetical protein [Leptolyngbya sp. FACHB-60]